MQFRHRSNNGKNEAMKRLLLLCTVPLFLAACGGNSTPEPSVNVSKQQTERLYGTWTFSYNANGTSFSNSYRLTELNASTKAGEYYLAGTDESGEVVVAGYNSDDKDFSLLDREPDFERFYVFDLTSDTAVKGCYFQVNIASNYFSECYEMTGVRTSANAAAPLSLKSSAAAHERLTPSSAANGSAIQQKYLSLKSLSN